MDALMNELLAEYARRGRFSHREHLHLAWSYVRRDGMPAAADRVAAFIRHVADRHGTPDKFNETMTRFWVIAVALAVRSSAEGADFEGVLADHPHLLDKDLPLRHWSAELLTSPAARAAWTAPDVRPLPSLAA